MAVAGFPRSAGVKNQSSSRNVPCLPDSPSGQSGIGAGAYLLLIRPVPTWAVMSTDVLVPRRDRDHLAAPVPGGVAIGWTFVALAGAALLQLAVYRNGGREALADVPGRFLAWRLGGHAFPYLDRGVEYPVVIGYLAYAIASVTGTATRFFVANGVIDVGLAVAMTCLLRVRGGARIWRWIAAPPLVLFAFHNWDLVVLVPAIIGLYAYMEHNDRVAGVSLAFGASTKLFPGLFLVPLAVRRWCAGDRRGATRLVAWAAGVLVVLNAPVLLLSRSGWWYPAAFQGRRRATWGTVWFWLFRLPGASHFTHHDPASSRTCSPRPRSSPRSRRSRCSACSGTSTRSRSAPRPRLRSC